MNDFSTKLNRLIAAAVISQGFRKTLLTNPALAMQGYGNERFGFTPTEREMILKIRASTLEEFANQAQQLVHKEPESATE